MQGELQIRLQSFNGAKDIHHSQAINFHHLQCHKHLVMVEKSIKSTRREALLRNGLRSFAQCAGEGPNGIQGGMVYPYICTIPHHNPRFFSDPFL